MVLYRSACTTRTLRWPGVTSLVGHTDGMGGDPFRKLGLSKSDRVLKSKHMIGVALRTVFGQTPCCGAGTSAIGLTDGYYDAQLVDHSWGQFIV